MKEKFATVVLGIFCGSWFLEAVPETSQRLVFVLVIVGTMISMMIGNKVANLVALLLQSMAFGAMLTFFFPQWGTLGPAICQVMLLVMTLVIVVYLGKESKGKVSKHTGDIDH